MKIVVIISNDNVVNDLGTYSETTRPLKYARVPPKLESIIIEQKK